MPREVTSVAVEGRLFELLLYPSSCCGWSALVLEGEKILVAAPGDSREEAMAAAEERLRQLLGMTGRAIPLRGSPGPAELDTRVGDPRLGRVIRVARSEAPRPGKMKLIEGQGVLLVNVAGTFYAFSVACPHRQGPLQQGRLAGEEIECPWHYFRWNVRTGRNVYPANVFPPDLDRDVPPHLISYPVHNRGAEMEIEIPQGQGKEQ